MQTVIDLSRIRNNVRQIRSKLSGAFCAVVKADAYGHGISVASYIEPVVDCFFVATPDEAFTLAAVVRKPVLVLGGDVSPFTRRFEPNIIPTVCDDRQALAMLKSGYNAFSVAVNTGMNRLGANERKLEAIEKFCVRYGVVPWSVYSHIYNGIASAREQSDEFDRLTASPVFRRMRHLYCSCALELGNVCVYDMTRIGLAMYGYAGGLDIAMRARAKITALSYVARGRHVGYGDYITERDTLVATVACGYADGLRRCDKPLYLKVGDRKCRIIGMPCMDVCMIDVTGVPCRVGEYAYLISDKSDTEYLAKCYGTIVYEVLTNFNGRAKRIYT